MSRAQDTEAVKDYFTREAERFDAIYDNANKSPLQRLVDVAFRTRMLNKRNQVIASLVDEGANCFEIGTGSGRTAVALATMRGARVHGIDIAAPMIELADRRAREASVSELCRFEVAGFDSFTPTERYDTFVAVGVLDYFADPLPMLRRAAEEFVRPGGSIVISWPVKGQVLNVARRAWLRTKGVPVTFYDDRAVAAATRTIGGHIALRHLTGTVGFLRDGAARVQLTAAEPKT